MPTPVEKRVAPRPRDLCLAAIDAALAPYFDATNSPINERWLLAAGYTNIR